MPLITLLIRQKLLVMVTVSSLQTFFALSQVFFASLFFHRSLTKHPLHQGRIPENVFAFAFIIKVYSDKNDRKTNGFKTGISCKTHPKQCQSPHKHPSKRAFPVCN